MLARSIIAPLRAAARPTFAAPSRAFSASRLALDTSSSPKPPAPSTGPANDASTANAAPSSSSTQQNRTQAGVSYRTSRSRSIAVTHRPPLTPYKPQPFTLKAGAVFVATGVGLWYYFQSEKEKVRERKRMETAAARVGRPKIGGPFLLTDQDGKPFSDKDLLGKWSMVYVSRQLRAFAVPTREPVPATDGFCCGGASSALRTAPTFAPKSSIR